MAAFEPTPDMHSAVPSEVAVFLRSLAKRLLAAGPEILVGVYVHGSAVLGDFQPGASDVDILVVVRDDVPRSSIQSTVELLATISACPGTGIEMSIVDKSAARRPSPPWPYRVHIATSPAKPKILWCEPGSGDRDLILHYALTRQSGWAAYGPSATEVVGEVGRLTIAGQLAAELRWAVDYASESYAVLNTCRALRWTQEMMLSSKTAGGMWALSNGIEPTLVRQAITDRQTLRTRKVSILASGFAIRVATVLEAGMPGQ